MNKKLIKVILGCLLLVALISAFVYQQKTQNFQNSLKKHQLKSKNLHKNLNVIKKLYPHDHLLEYYHLFQPDEDGPIDPADPNLGQEFGDGEEDEWDPSGEIDDDGEDFLLFIKKQKSLPNLKHKCHHDQLVNELEQKVEKLKKEKGEKEEPQIWQVTEDKSTFKPIRIKVDYSNLDKNAAKYKQFITDKIMPPVLSYFSSVFTVNQVSGNIPVYAPWYQNDYCGNNNEAAIPASIIANGVPNSDVLILVDARDATGEGWLAHAAKCDQGPKNLASGRPSIGYATINLAYLKDGMNQNRWFTWIETMIHELMHAFGFSSGLFKQFAQKDVVKQVNGIWYFMGTDAVNFGKSYFNCQNPSLLGLPLENEGGGGTAGSHWERVTFGNEGMTGSDFGDAVYSEFTLNVFKASGWYSPVMSNAQPLVWGKNDGCDLMKGICSNKAQEFSCKQNTKGCNFDYSGTGVCSTLQFAEGCNYMAGYSNTGCLTADKSWADGWKKYGGGIGPDSRCWEGSFGTGCFETECTGNDVPQIKLGGTWLPCTAPGAVITNNGNKFTCPPDFTSFCGVENSCPNACTARGTCKKAKCYCYQGYKGVDCAEIDMNTSTTNQQNPTPTPTPTPTPVTTKANQPNCASTDTYINQEGYGQLCCDKNWTCCPLHAQLKSGACYCIAGTKLNSVKGSCDY